MLGGRCRLFGVHFGISLRCILPELHAVGVETKPKGRRGKQEAGELSRTLGTCRFVGTVQATQGKLSEMQWFRGTRT